MEIEPAVAVTAHVAKTIESHQEPTTFRRFRRMFIVI